MPRIKVITQSFPHNNQWTVGNRSMEIDISIPELLHAAITVGHPDYSVVLGGGQVAAGYEMMWKMASTMMTLREFSGPSSRSYLTPTGRFENLDPSEKRGATYQMGLTVNKIVAWRLFGIRWLLHLDVYASRLSPVIRSGRSRPDLIGQDDGGGYYVFESKGRISPPNAKDKQKAKAQSQRIVSVSGTTPVLAASSMAYFRKERHRTRKHLECFVEDPPFEEAGEDIETHELNIGSIEIIRDYYRPLIPLFEDAVKAEDAETLIWKSREFDVEILIDANVNYLWRSEQYAAIRSYLLERTPHTGISESHVYDGIEIRPGERWLELATQDYTEE